MYGPGVVVAVLVVVGMYYWGRHSTQCAETHWRWGRCQLKPGHFPNTHRGRGGHGWR